jgi:hypothetical protein
MRWFRDVRAPMRVVARNHGVVFHVFLANLIVRLIESQGTPIGNKTRDGIIEIMMKCSIKIII